MSKLLGDITFKDSFGSPFLIFDVDANGVSGKVLNYPSKQVLMEFKTENIYSRGILNISYGTKLIGINYGTRLTNTDKDRYEVFTHYPKSDNNMFIEHNKYSERWILRSKRQSKILLEIDKGKVRTVDNTHPSRNRKIDRGTVVGSVCPLVLLSAWVFIYGSVGLIGQRVNRKIK